MRFETRSPIAYHLETHFETPLPCLFLWCLRPLRPCRDSGYYNTILKGFNRAQFSFRPQFENFNPPLAPNPAQWQGSNLVGHNIKMPISCTACTSRRRPLTYKDCLRGVTPRLRTAPQKNPNGKVFCDTRTHSTESLNTAHVPSYSNLTRPNIWVNQHKHQVIRRVTHPFFSAKWALQSPKKQSSKQLPVSTECCLLLTKWLASNMCFPKWCIHRTIYGGPLLNLLQTPTTLTPQGC